MLAGMNDEQIEREFRKVGFTAHAASFPLSSDALEVVSELNGVPVEQMPLGWRYAPNKYMHDWYEWLGKEMAAGRPVRDGNRVRLKPQQ